MRHTLVLLLVLLAGCGFGAELGLGPNPVATSVSGGTVNVTSVTDSGLTSGRVPYASTGGLLADAAGLTFNGTTLVVPNETNSSLTATRVPYAGTAGLMQDDSGFTRTALALVLDANTDNTLTTGYGKLGLAGSGTSTVFYVAQTSAYNSTDYALSQTSGGATRINGKTGTTLIFGINNANKIQLLTGSCTFVSGVNVIASDSTDATSKTTGAVTTVGGLSAGKNVIAGEGIAQGVASTVTAAGTTTLTSASAGVQIFTGSTTQTVQLPAANLFGAGVSVQYTIINRSTGSVTANRAGSDTINAAATSFAVTTLTTTIFNSDGVSAWYTK